MFNYLFEKKQLNSDFTYWSNWFFTMHVNILYNIRIISYVLKCIIKSDSPNKLRSSAVLILKQYLNLPLHIFLKILLLWPLFDFDSRFNGFYFNRFLKRRKHNKACIKLLLRRYEMACVNIFKLKTQEVKVFLEINFQIQILTYCSYFYNNS